ncbi:aspartate/glutamate racemase family protein [Robbsia sp. KACC 23696]|uniref:glutamate racemase n=1 Tax=Robbsia sp. KACC 23696 TaxID=3149231 RepID=UPI00325A920F
MSIDKHTLHRPVGIFDAGIGSYAIVRLVQQHYPQQDVLYLADRASFPYGAKDKDALFDVTSAAISRLRTMGAEAIIVASNAPSITVLDAIRKTVAGPLLGVYPPVARAIAISKSKSVGLLGVQSLVDSAELRQYVLTQSADNGRVTAFNASPLVALVEAGDFIKNRALTQETIRRFLAPIMTANDAIDVFMLSSTHLPWLRPLLEAVAPRCVFLDPAEEVVARLAPHVTEGSGTVSAIVTASSAYPFHEFEAMLHKLDIPLKTEWVE